MNKPKNGRDCMGLCEIFFFFFTSFGLYCAINCIVHGHYIIAHFSALLQQDVLLLLLPFYRLFNE